MEQLQTNLFGKTYTEIQEIVNDLSLPSYSTGQICDWLYKKNADSIEKISNLSKSARTALSKQYTIRHDTPQDFQVSSDGTKKYLFLTIRSRYIEAAYIPEVSRHTVCISSQVGCKWGCLFCMTGKQGFQGNLTAAEILNQFAGIPEKDIITNIVYMGMGEPLDNPDEVLKSLEILTSSYGYAMSPSRITVSTIGIIPALKVFLEKSNCHLAVSLHSPFSDERKQIMPVESVFPVKEVVETLKSYKLGRQRRISFEYIMFKGFNDTRRHVNEIARLLNGMKCRINLIRLHSVPGIPFKSSEDDTILRFRNSLSGKGIITTIRASRGLDILAACGLLSTRHLSNNKLLTSSD
ncbi:MAG TPA: 23S rRNA (adenine(2503)-C(2))-methyltransferase RlmN [Bacteroidales bacterium]|nr:23S rRNA (adenine(2503)-C(2))-methyltransferase RlmN [Bacteroidales bacterium]